MKKNRKVVSLLTIGLALILIGFMFIIISSFSGGKGNVEIAAGGFIGPIPFGFFTSPGMFWIWIIIFAIAILAWIIFRFSKGF